jgi:hypothetical protein
MNKHIFCDRKGGVTHKGKFTPSPTVTQILSDQLERTAKKINHRANKLEARRQRKNS